MARRDSENYNYTVTSLLKAAGTKRSTGKCEGKVETEHVVELQLVVAAINTLKEGTYRRDDWERDLVRIFNDENNLQCLTKKKNGEKSQAVSKFIRIRNGSGESLSPKEKEWLKQVKKYWLAIRSELNCSDFKRIRNALDKLLEVQGGHKRFVGNIIK